MVLSVSIVSHGHAAHVRRLLALLSWPDATPLQRVWLTLNLPEPELAGLLEQPWSFDLQVVPNVMPKGFGANHNQAFACEQAMPRPADLFCVLNPDMAWQSDPFPALLAALDGPGAGCAYPLQLDTMGRVQDHRRMLPSPFSLLRRHLARDPSTPIVAPEWVNAAFLVFPAPVYAHLGGFDTKYFMYCEDVDLSLRLQLSGYTLVEACTAHVVHDASRASRRDLQHLIWHVRSLVRLWCSPTYRRFRSLQSKAATRS